MAVLRAACLQGRAGWSLVGVADTGDQVLVEATGPNPAPSLAGWGPVPATFASRLGL